MARAAAAALVLVAGAAATVPAEDWARFRGPNGQGVADVPGLPAALSPANLAYRVALPPGHSSPILSGDRIFLTAADGDKLLTICLRQADGHELWRREAPRPRLETFDKRNGPASPSPAADARRVVVFFGDFGLVAYDHDGRELWRAPLGPFQNAYGMGSSPVLADGLVLLVCDQLRDSFAVAFDAETGREKWRRERPDALSGHSTPVLYAPAHGGRQLLAPGSFKLSAYDVRTGAEVWWANGLPSELKSGAVLGDGAVYVVGYNSPLNEPGKLPTLPPYAKWKEDHDLNHDGCVTREEADPDTRMAFQFVDIDRDGCISEAEWRTNQRVYSVENGLLAFRLEGKGDATEGLLWKYQRSVPQLPTPLLYRGLLYMINDGGVLTTLRPATGDVLKRGRLGDAVDQYYASPVAGDGKVYFVSRSGIVSVLRAGAEQQRLSTNDLEDEVTATPALAKGRVYLRTRGALYCFEEKGRRAERGGDVRRP
jgi:outer membrane protein assembly factor BamB